MFLTDDCLTGINFSFESQDSTVLDSSLFEGKISFESPGFYLARVRYFQREPFSITYWADLKSTHLFSKEIPYDSLLAFAKELNGVFYIEDLFKDPLVVQMKVNEKQVIKLHD